MWKFLLRRILALFAMLFVITSLLFFLRTKIPSDPIEKILIIEGKEELDDQRYLQEYRLLATQYKLDLPLFYFALVPRNYPKAIHKVLPINDRREQIAQLTQEGIHFPSLRWYGMDNQYHHWISGVLSGDLSISLKDGRPVGAKVKEAMKWSITLMFFSMMLSIALGIPIGLWLSNRGRTRWKRFVTSIGFVLYAMPLFYLSTLMLIFFTTTEYGTWTNIFPSVDLVPMSQESGFLSKLWAFSSHLILPAVCWTLHSLAYMSIQMKVSMKQQLGKQYFKTALAKGLSEASAGKRHALRNAMIPMITMILAAIPGALGGTVIIETIFNIPGMGLLLIESIFGLDWNVVMGILLILAVIIILTHLLADLLYAWVDPKLKSAIDDE